MQLVRQKPVGWIRCLFPSFSNVVEDKLFSQIKVSLEIEENAQDDAAAVEYIEPVI